MKVKLISFQEKAVRDLRSVIAAVLDVYRRTKKTQVISLQAPTGAGKTIVAAALIEDIYFGSVLPDGSVFEEQPDAIFVWLSDSPELNEQSKQKIELKTSKLRFGQCVQISDGSFDLEMLEDGHIYFLNTQKIGKAGRLTQRADRRKYTIWDTLNNTVLNKSDRLYFIIDEAHRGAKDKREAGRDTTIMQRFIKGWEYSENGMKRKLLPMPVILGISATADRFNALVGNTANVGLQRCIITSDEVRGSGLLKDRIVITYPDDPEKNNDTVLLEKATEEWLKKCKRWYQYTSEQHYANVDPVFVIQVRQGSSGALSDTDLGDVLSKIEETVGTSFKSGEVVHCFGENASVEIGGLKVPHVNASEIADDHRIKIVFFKEALSTGWDCPRAETMMSYAVRNDPTYIAQLLGRMVRTPLRMRVSRDEFLNDVKLYLPHFDKETVRRIVDELQSSEGGEIPTEIDGESLEEPVFTTWSANVRSRLRQIVPDPNSISIFDLIGREGSVLPQDGGSAENGPLPAAGEGAPEYLPVPKEGPFSPVCIPAPKETHGTQLRIATELDRTEIVDYINAKGFLTYFVRQERINDYLKSLLDLAGLLTRNLIDRDAPKTSIETVNDDIIGFIRTYIDDLHRTGRYDALAERVLEFKLSVQIFDPFGKPISDSGLTGLTLLSESDLDRQMHNADAKLGGYGFPNLYGIRYYDEATPNEYKIDCILYAADEGCRTKLGEYAKNKLYELSRKYRLAIVNRSGACQKQYHDIMADSDIVSEQNFAIPENLVIREDPSGTEYFDHLLVSPETGIARIKLGGWETTLIEAESRRPDFVCWLRNQSRAAWALCLPYKMGGETKPLYPDFLIVRRDPDLGYVVDLLEPHGSHLADSLPKAKGLAEYAKNEDRFGRIQLLRKCADGRFVRLELTDIQVREKVLKAHSDEELDHLFETDGIFE